MIRLRREEFDRAKAHFRHALDRLDDLGALFGKYEIAAQASLPITEDIFAHVLPARARHPAGAGRDRADRRTAIAMRWRILNG